MKTELITDNIPLAADIIKNGGLVAVPTETVYGLAGNGLDETAVEKIYEVKGRPAVKPLSLMVPGAEAMAEYCEDVPEAAYFLAEKYWPGPLTIVLKAKPHIPSIVLAGGTTVGLRCPDHGKTLSLLRSCALPLAAPSANPSGAPSPKNAQTVMDYFEGSIDAVIDGGECGIGRESTLIDLSRTPYRVLREAAVSETELRAALRSRVKLIGITGGSGCGKTTALSVLGEYGALILDCDKIYHELLESSADMLRELDESFPGVIEDGRLNRARLAQAVFSDSVKLSRLNAITHKYVIAELERRISDFAMCGGSIAAIDAIELKSSGLSDGCSVNIAVTADKQRRIERIMQRDNISEQAARARVEAQHDAAYFAEFCDYVLENNFGREQFEEDCRRIFKEAINHE